MTCENAEDASATAHVQHHFVLEQLGVVDDGLHVRLGPDRVLEHLLVDRKVRVAVEVVVAVLDVAHVRLAVL